MKAEKESQKVISFDKFIPNIRKGELTWVKEN